jgi:hypothetical protein
MRGVTYRSTAGFWLIETMMATTILASGLLSLAGVFAIGLQHVAGSSPTVIAREKAREAIESVFTARDTRVIAWAQIRNAPAGGVFLANAQPLLTPGTDGLVNTADDGPIESLRSAGPDQILGTVDDILIPLTNYTREIRITDVLENGVVDPNLRQIQVIIRFEVNSMWRTYTLTTYISSFS